MKALKNVTIVFVFLFATITFAQESHIIKGNTYSLNTEVEGPLTLLWNVIDNEYRYFAKKGDEVVELKNTRVDGKYQEEYKQTLTQFTADYPVDASRTNITLAGLRGYFNSYNKLADTSYVETNNNVELSTRLGAFAGMSNNNSTTNPENVFAPLAGIEFEVTDEEMLKRHALVLQFRHSFEAADYDLTYSQIALNL